MKALPVRRLSAIITQVAQTLHEKFGLEKLFIGGGSAPALLDHIYAGTALRMRDLDLICVANRIVDERLARKAGEACDTPDLRFLPRYVYPRRRSRNEHDMMIAGWGAIWDANGLEIDLSIFHDDATLRLNGLLNVDRILIPLTPGTSFTELAARMMLAGSPEAALAERLFVDPHHGYASWHNRHPRIIAWTAVHASPIESAIRIVRCCTNKLHVHHLHSDLADPLRDAIMRGNNRGDRFLRVRTLIKLLHDDRAGAELEMLHDLGVFQEWLPEVGEVVGRLGHGALLGLLTEADREGRRDAEHHAAFAAAGEQGGTEISAMRLEALLLNMRSEHRNKVLEEIALAEPMFAALVRAQMPHVEHRPRMPRTRRAVRAVTRSVRKMLPSIS
ncbi:MAG TPA: hypothetical protein VJ901_22110 [Thermoanaerobaculia bacterium]|nr:hypothetical protein [Thermoanaerobaculia bacterium]